jgi:hypothetical protein
MDIIETIKFTLFVLFIISIPLTAISMVGMATGLYPHSTTYSYDVKAEQVQDVDRVEDSDVTEIENLSADEKKLLYDAFKKTDHFRGSSQVSLHYQDERLDTFNDWRTVESNGVLLLVAVSESSERTPDSTEYTVFHWILLLSIVYFAISLLTMMFPRRFE